MKFSWIIRIWGSLQNTAQFTYCATAITLEPFSAIGVSGFFPFVMLMTPSGQSEDKQVPTLLVVLCSLAKRVWMHLITQLNHIGRSRFKFFFKNLKWIFKDSTHCNPQEYWISCYRSWSNVNLRDKTKLVNPGKNMCRSSKTKLISIIYTEIRIQLDQNIQECLGFRHGARLPITNSYPSSKIASNLSIYRHVYVCVDAHMRVHAL